MLQVHVTKDILINAVQHVLKAVSLHSPTSVLSGIFIEASTDLIVLTGSNTSLMVQSRIPVNRNAVIVHQPGKIVVSARYFYEIIRKLHNGMITLEVKDRLILTITSQNAHLRLSGIDPAEIPSIQHSEHNDSKKISVSTVLLRSVIRQVSTVVSMTETRPILTGVSFEIHEDTLTLVATDGVVRMAHRSIHIENGEEYSGRFIIPGKNLCEISKMLRNEDEMTAIEILDHQIRFIVQDLLIQSALIDGTFPQTSNLIPSSFVTEITVNTALLQQIAERVFVLAGESLIMLKVSDCRLNLISNTLEIGDARDEVPLEAMDGEQFEVSLNGKLFIDTLRSMGTASIRVKFAGKKMPIVIVPTDPGSTLLFLIAPVMTR